MLRERRLSGSAGILAGTVEYNERYIFKQV
jgi:hypothetical protein